MPGPDGPTKTDLLQNKVFLEAQKANHYIDNTVETFKDTVDQLLGRGPDGKQGLRHDNESGGEQVPLRRRMLFGVILTLLPSLKILQLTTGPGGLNLKTGLKLVRVLEDKLDDLTKNFVDPLWAKDEKKENVTQQQQILAASNSAIKAELGAMYDLSQKVTDAAKKARKYIRMKSGEFLSGKDANVSLLPKIQNDFKEVGIDDNSSVGKERFLLLSDKILYDMLRKYVETYVVFKIADRAERMNTYVNMQHFIDMNALRTRRIADLPQSRGDYFIQGIDEAKRDAIYGRFKNGVIGDIKRPGVKDYKDLIRHWKAGTVGTSGAKLLLT